MVGLSRWRAFGVAGDDGTLGDDRSTFRIGVSTLGGEERCCVSSPEVVTWDGMLVGASDVGIAGDGAPLGDSAGSSVWFGSCYFFEFFCVLV
jgi:hypothetical protein